MTKKLFLLLIFIFPSELLFSAEVPDCPPDRFFFELERKAAAGEDNGEARGICLLYGYGTPVRIQAAKKHLQGLPPCGTYGEPYFIRFQGMKDAALFRKAEKEAENLSVPAMRIAAFCCWFGRGTEKNRLRAISYYRQAASAGDPVSSTFLARLTGDTELHARSVRLNRLMKSFPRAYQPVLAEGKGIALRDGEPVSEYLSRLLQEWKSGQSVYIFMGAWE